MGPIYTTVILQNADDIALAKHKHIGHDEVRELQVEAMVDTGSIMLCINEAVREALGLDIIDYRPSRLADNTRIKLPVAGPVVVRFQDRFCITDALVLPGDSKVLLGAISMEEMDVYAHPGRRELLPVDPEGPVMMLKPIS